MNLLVWGAALIGAATIIATGWRDRRHGHSVWHRLTDDECLSEERRC